MPNHNIERVAGQHKSLLDLRTKQGIRRAVPILAHEIVHGSLTYGVAFDLLTQAFTRHVWSGRDHGTLVKFERRLSIALVTACDAAEEASSQISEHEQKWAPLLCPELMDVWDTDAHE